MKTLISAIPTFLVFICLSASVMVLSSFIPPEIGEDVGTFIVGGEAVRKNELPYQISLRRNGKHICGGAIINSGHIVTVAHCVDIGKASEFIVVAGDHSLASDDGTEQLRNVSKVTIHEDYDAWMRTSDIAVLQLDAPLTLNGAVKDIVLPVKELEDLSGFNATISGWGYIDAEGEYPEDALQKTEVPVLTDEECREAYSAMDIVDSVLCAGYLKEGGHDSCGGDDGGPLVSTVENPDGSFKNTLLGLFSWTHNYCGSPKFPGVYTEVAYFIDWIQSHTN